MHPMKTLTPTDRRALKARAHALKPVVMISDAGLSAGVLTEIERGLKSHELIKIKVSGDDRERRETLLAEICERSGASAIQHIGKILIVYRENPKPVVRVRPVVRKPPPARRAKAPPARNASRSFRPGGARQPVSARPRNPRKRT